MEFIDPLFPVRCTCGRPTPVNYDKYMKYVAETTIDGMMLPQLALDKIDEHLLSKKMSKLKICCRMIYISNIHSVYTNMERYGTFDDFVEKSKK